MCSNRKKMTSKPLLSSYKYVRDTLFSLFVRKCILFYIKTIH